MSQNIFERINDEKNKQNEDDKQIPSKLVIKTVDKNEANIWLENDLTKIMNLLFVLLKEKNEISIIDPQIISILIESELKENNNLDDEFQNAINILCESDSYINKKIKYI